jgi:hypothetical protein
MANPLVYIPLGAGSGNNLDIIRYSYGIQTCIE